MTQTQNSTQKHIQRHVPTGEVGFEHPDAPLDMMQTAPTLGEEIRAMVGDNPHGIEDQIPAIFGDKAKRDGGAALQAAGVLIDEVYPRGEYSAAEPRVPTTERKIIEVVESGAPIRRKHGLPSPFPRIIPVGLRATSTDSGQRAIEGLTSLSSRQNRLGQRLRPIIGQREPKY